MRYLVIATILLILSGCSTTQTICDIDTKVNDRITKSFERQDQTLWWRMETEFFNRLFEIDTMFSKVDKKSALIGLMVMVSERGYPFEFYVDFEDDDTRELLEELKSIGITADEEQVNRYLYDIINPVVKHSRNMETLKEYPQDLLTAYGVTNPDSANLSFDLATTELWRHYGVMDMKRPGLYKTLITLFFMKMINEKNKMTAPNQNQTH